LKSLGIQVDEFLPSLLQFILKWNRRTLPLMMRLHTIVAHTIVAHTIVAHTIVAHTIVAHTIVAHTIVAQRPGKEAGEEEREQKAGNTDSSCKPLTLKVL